MSSPTTGLHCSSWVPSQMSAERPNNSIKPNWLRQSAYLGRWASKGLFMKAIHIAAYLAGMLACASATAQELDEATRVELQREADHCRTSPQQTVSFRLIYVPGKPASEPVTPEEEAQMREALKVSDLKSYRPDHQATYLATLAMLRTRSALSFAITPKGDAASQLSVRACLSKLATDAGAGAGAVFEP